MNLVPREVDKLVLRQAGRLAQERLARGVRLNHPESMALIASQVLEFIRDGKSVAELMDLGKQMLGTVHVMPGVRHMLHEVQVEGTFPDGSKLVTVHDPVCSETGNIELALQGSFLPIPAKGTFGGGGGGAGGSKKRKRVTAVAVEEEDDTAPGAVTFADGEIAINVGRPTVRLTVANTSDRPIQVGSHFHFAEANALLAFDRTKAHRMRLHIAAGTAVRFEPGDKKTVTLVSIAGAKVVRGGNNLLPGPVAQPGAAEMLVKACAEGGFAHVPEPNAPATADGIGHECTLTRPQYASMYGPTTGDVVRLGDSNLLVKVEADRTVHGDECKFGGGKVLREGMGQQAGVGPGASVLDLVITNALVVDYTGIYKADVGVRGVNIVGIGKAGNPDVMEGVTPGMVVGVNTEVIAGEGLILTAGGLDVHIHYICPQIADEAIAAGLTTLLGGGTGPATGSKATTCTPAPDHVKMMLQATDDIPINFAFTGKGNTAMPEGLAEVITAGAVGLKLHEDWGTTPAAIDNCLTVCDRMDVQVTIHTDTLNESCCVERSVAAFKGRTIHTYHSEGAGGGHAPDIIKVCSEPNVLPSSTNPTRPYTKNTLEEHVDMLMVCHHLDKNIPEDVAFAESRIRGETIAAEDVLHDMGAISIIASDSQAMGRVGEVITRTWQTADKNKLQRGEIPEDAGTGVDNARVKRYIAKYTVNPAIAHGMSHLIGSVEVGKMADLVLWNPAFFGAKPEMVIKGGTIAAAQMGDANASIPTPEPVLMRPMFGALGKAVGGCSVAFVSQAAVDAGKGKEYGLSKALAAVKKCRGLSKADMKLNTALPKITVDPETYKVTADGEEVTCEPVDKLPMAQKYFLF